MNILKRVIHSILDLIFPEECFGCGTKNTLLCSECLKELPYSAKPALSADRALRGKPETLGATSYGSEVIQKAIRALKYKKAKGLAEPLAKLIYQRLFKETGFPLGNPVSKYPPILIPIPLSKKRLRERGFNQSELIAKHLSDKLRFSLCPNVLYRNRHTISQVEIKDKEKRLKNLEGAFSVKNPELIKKRTIFVIDDVSTTGATIKEAQRALKQAGAKKVTGLVVAKG